MAAQAGRAPFAREKLRQRRQGDAENALGAASADRFCDEGSAGPADWSDDNQSVGAANEERLAGLKEVENVAEMPRRSELRSVSGRRLWL